MTTPNVDTTAGAESVPGTKQARSTKRSTWWKRGPNLVQHTPTGTFYARIKINGKLIRQSLETDVWSTAKLKLPDKIKELSRPKAEVGTFGFGKAKYQAETNGGYTNRKGQLVKLAPLSIAYRLRCLECLVRSLVEQFEDKEWKKMSEGEQANAVAGLDAMKADEITREICETWQTTYSNRYSPTVFNNTVNTFRRVLELAGLQRDNNAAYRVGRLAIPETDLKLPRPEQFERIITLIETSGAAQARDCADLVRFLAFTGTRISEAKKAVWADVDWQANAMQIHSVKVRGGSDRDVTRTIPLNPALKQLLERLRVEQKPQPTHRICVLSECQGALTRACRMIGCARLTHHDLRHYFVTKCLQAGVDVFTLAKWVGHRDNGKLLLKVYAHLQAEHSQSMALKVTFGVSTPDNVHQLAQAQSV